MEITQNLLLENAFTNSLAFSKSICGEIPSYPSLIMEMFLECSAFSRARSAIVALFGRVCTERKAAALPSIEGITWQHWPNLAH